MRGHCAFIISDVIHGRTESPGMTQKRGRVRWPAGLVEIEEGELTGQQLNLQSQALARVSFAREPHVQKVRL